MFALSLLAIVACRHRPGGSGRPGERILRPDSVSFSGIRFGQTSREVQASVGNLQCVRSEPDEDICSFVPGVQDRKGRFRGVERVRCRFHRDSLEKILVEYAEMLDVEFAVFDRGMWDKYGNLPAPQAPDSVFTEWRYDLVVVSLTPNRRPHWIGQVTTYKPVVEFVKR